MPSADPTNPKGMTPSRGVRRSRGEDAYPNADHRFDAVPSDFRKVEGWGADLDPKNRPMVPMELPSNVKSVRGEVTHRQIPRHQVFLSNEMPDMPPVFGESCPPRGLSGLIRAWAFEYGEGRPRHWLGLMLADRVDVIESLVLGLVTGHPDNILRERGMSARITYADPSSRRRMMLAVGTIAVAGLAIAMRPSLANQLMRYSPLPRRRSTFARKMAPLKDAILHTEIPGTPGTPLAKTLSRAGNSLASRVAATAASAASEASRQRKRIDLSGRTLPRRPLVLVQEPRDVRITR